MPRRWAKVEVATSARDREQPPVAEWNLLSAPFSSSLEDFMSRQGGNAEMSCQCNVPSGWAPVSRPSMVCCKSSHLLHRRTTDERPRNFNSRISQAFRRSSWRATVHSALAKNLNRSKQLVPPPCPPRQALRPNPPLVAFELIRLCLIQPIDKSHLQPPNLKRYRRRWKLLSRYLGKLGETFGVGFSSELSDSLKI